MQKGISDFKKKLFSEITSVPEILKPTHLPGLDGMRGIAIIMVIVYHFYMSSDSMKSVGPIGVWVFFSISGFLITTLLLKEKIATGNICLKQFYIRRILRIFPVVFLFVIILSIINYYEKLGINFLSFLSAIFFFQNFRGGNSSWYVQHFWSLSVEEQFYLTFPILLVYNLNKYIKITIFLIIFIPIIEYLGYEKIGVFYTNHIIHNITFALINLFGSSIDILCGSLMSILLFKNVIVIKDNVFTRYLGIVVFVISILICADGSAIFISESQLLFFPILISIVLILNLNANSLFTKILGNKLLIYIGILSYSLYIWQQLFDNPNYWFVQSKSILLHVFILLTVANASYYLWEKKFLRLRDKFLPKKATETFL